MLLKGLAGDRSGVSSSVKVVLTSSAGVAIALAAMLWLSSFTTDFTGYEDIRIVSQNCYFNSGEEAFKIRIRVRNAGAPTYVKEVLVNNVPLGYLEDAGVSWVVEEDGSGEGLPIPLSTGVNVDVEIKIPDKTVCGKSVVTSNVMVNIALQSAGGFKYPVVMILP